MQAFAALLPAATTTVMPALIAELIAASSVALTPPPRLILITALDPVVYCRITQLTPLTTSEIYPEPKQSRTRTGTSETPLATP